MAEEYHHKLPKEVKYEDVLTCELLPLDTLLKIPELELEPDDVIVASYPKTGTTLIQEVVWLIRHHGNVELANQTQNVTRIPFVEYGPAGDLLEYFKSLQRPRTMKTHVPYRFLPKAARDQVTKMVYIIRNPKDTLVSYYHFYRMNACFGNFKGTWNDWFNHFRTNGYLLGYGNPLDHYKAFWEHRNDENLLIVFYEDIVENPKENICKIAEFLEETLPEEALERICKATSFDVMKNNPSTNMTGDLLASVFDHSISPFMRKGKVGDWKNYFTEEQNKIIDDMVQEKLNGTGLTFRYE